MGKSTATPFPSKMSLESVERISGIAELQTRSKVAVVSKAFASAARRVPDLSVSDQNFIGADCLLKAEIADRMQAAFGEIAVLRIQGLSRVQVPCVFQVVRSCQRLKSVYLEWQPSAKSIRWNSAVTECLLSLVHTDTLEASKLKQLQHVYIGSEQRVEFRATATQSCLCGQNLMACTTAASLAILQCLRFQISRIPQLARLTWPCDSIDPEESILALFPALEWLDLGNGGLRTEFRGRVTGLLPRGTINTFASASAVHCLGFVQQEVFWPPNPVNTIKTWTSNDAPPGLVLAIAPSLEKLMIDAPGQMPGGHHVWSCNDWVLNPHLSHVQVACKLQGSLFIAGLPSINLSYLHLDIQCHCIMVSKQLFVWVKSRACLASC